jgi:hypothetical protein
MPARPLGKDLLRGGERFLKAVDPDRAGESVVFRFGEEVKLVA